MKKTRVGQIISCLLVKKGLCVTELARLVKLPQPTVHRIVNGVCEHPHRSSLQPIADFFAVSIDQLKGYEPIRGLDIISKVPLLDWLDVNFWLQNNQQVIPVNWIVTDVAISVSGFAVRLMDDAMDPIFPSSSTLIVDPDKPAKHLNFVVAQVENHNRPIFRQLISNRHNFYLKPLNPDIDCYNIIKLSDNDKILGSVVQVKRDLEG